MPNNKYFFSIYLRAILFAILFFLFFCFTPAVNAQEQPKTSFKKGAGVAGGCGHLSDPAQKNACRTKHRQKLKELGITWFYNWSTDYSQFIGWNEFEFVPMIIDLGEDQNGEYSDAQINRFKNTAQAKPGSYWLIWNEPNYWAKPASRNYSKVRDINSDGTKTVQEAAVTAAHVYKKLHDGIKTADPNAKFIIGGVVSSEGSDYLDYNTWPTAFINTYTSGTIGGSLNDIDGWHYHLYRCQNYSLNGWRDSFTNWIKKYMPGGDSKELWITEFGCFIEPGNQTAVKIIQEQVDWMENQDYITRYAWYWAGVPTIYTPDSHYSNLFIYKLPDDPSFGLSSLGNLYAQYPTISSSTPPPSPTTTPTRTPAPTRTPTPTPTPTHSSSPSPSASPANLRIVLQKGINAVVLPASVNDQTAMDIPSQCANPNRKLSAKKDGFFKPFIGSYSKNVNLDPDTRYYIYCRSDNVLW